MSYQVKGLLYKVFDTETKSETFRVRDFVIKTEGNYPQLIKFQCTQDKCDMLNGLEEGQQVNVSFDLRGREWQGRYFTNLNAWKIEGETQADEMNQERPPVDEIPMSEREDLDDDLPF